MMPLNKPESPTESGVVLRHVGFQMLRECHQIFPNAGDVLPGREAEIGECGALHCSLPCCLGRPQFEARHKLKLAADWVKHDVEGGLLQVAASGAQQRNRLLQQRSDSTCMNSALRVFKRRWLFNLSWKRQRHRALQELDILLGHRATDGVAARLGTRLPRGRENLGCNRGRHGRVICPGIQPICLK